MKQIRLFLVLLSFILVFTACSKDKNNEPNENNDNNDIVDNEEDEKDEEDEEGEEESEETVTTPSTDDSDFDSLLADVEEKTQGETNVIYETDEVQTHKESEYTVTLDGYVVAEVTDYHMDFATPLGSEEKGAVLLTNITVENKSDEDIAYTPNWNIQYSGADRHPGPNASIISKDVQLSNLLNSDNNYEIPAGESVSGYVAFTLHEEDVENIEKVNYAILEVPNAGDVYKPDDYEYENKIGKPSEFKIHVNDGGSEKDTADGEFYQDAINTKNMGDKTMIKEKSDIDMTETLGNSKVTLDGYQFTEYKPNETEAPRFEDSDTGIVILTIKMLIENNEDEALDQDALVGKLTVNDGKQYLLQEGFLSPYKYGDEIEPGDSDEMLIVFIMDKEQYEKIWKDKAFEFEFGPLKGVDTSDLSKGKRLEFDLPK